MRSCRQTSCGRGQPRLSSEHSVISHCALLDTGSLDYPINMINRPPGIQLIEAVASTLRHPGDPHLPPHHLPSFLHPDPTTGRRGGRAQSHGGPGAPSASLSSFVTKHLLSFKHLCSVAEIVSFIVYYCHGKLTIREGIDLVIINIY